MPIKKSAIKRDPVVYNQDILLDISDRSNPNDYIQALRLKPNGGYEIFQVAAKIGERVSTAIGNCYEGMFLISAIEGNKAIGEVEFYRGSVAFGAIEIQKGTIVSTNSGKGFEILENITFGAMEFGPKTAQIRAKSVGFDWNVKGESTTIAGELLEGEIDKIRKAKFRDPITLNPAIDPEMKVRNITATVQGQDNELGLLGEDLKIRKRSFESEEAYRLRLLNAIDTISLEAVVRELRSILYAHDEGGCIREVGTPKFPGFFFDAGASNDTIPHHTRNYAFDMDPTIFPFSRFKLMLDTIESRGFLLVGLPKLISLEHAGLTFDGTILDTYKTSNAFDTTAEGAKNAAFDGIDILNIAIYQAIDASLKEKLAGGVGFDLYLEELGCF